MSVLAPAIEDYLGVLVERLRAHLGDGLAGAWLFGSGALGDFDRARSDLDVQAVAEEAPPLAAREALAAALSHEALACPVRGLEFVLYTRAGLADPDGPAFVLNLNTGPRMERHVAYDAGEDPRFWFVLDVAIGREAGRPLAGPPPAEVFPRLPRTLVVAALRDALGWHVAHDPAAAVLAACRAWAWARDGRWLPKGDAARWAARRLGDPAPVEAA
ncbi:MAG TPA: nucleotidyltransferase domain-containing protein, partial [Solirubrobacteraceae bacterium]|nr:nucleotidyltransferase domain-containing protein [Solirubrobacteraceae bacterium]